MYIEMQFLITYCIDIRIIVSIILTLLSIDLIIVRLVTYYILHILKTDFY